MSATDETPRPHRMTLSEVVERLTEQRSSSPHLPTFEVSSKAPTAEQTKQGITAVYQWSASVPVCPEFPTADDAFRAARRYADELRKAYPPDTKPDDLGRQLNDSIESGEIFRRREKNEKS